MDLDLKKKKETLIESLLLACLTHSNFQQVFVNKGDLLEKTTFYNFAFSHLFNQRVLAFPLL